MSKQNIFIGYHGEPGLRTIEAYPPSPELIKELKDSDDFTLCTDTGDGCIGVLEDKARPGEIIRRMEGIFKSVFGEDFKAIPCTSEEYDRALAGAKKDRDHVRSPLGSSLAKGSITIAPHSLSAGPSPQLQPR